MKDYESKANQLINKYFDAVPHRHTCRKLAKKLAIIAVDEILVELSKNIKIRAVTEVITSNEFWINVKNELLKN